MDTSVLHKISYGVYLVTSKNGERINGQIANTVFQLTNNPIQLAISIAKTNLTHEFITQSKVFSMMILAENWTMLDIGCFGFRCGRDIDKFVGKKYKIGNNGAPILLEKTVGYTECEVVQTVDTGSHTLFIGQVTNSEIINKDLIPMTYAYYHRVLKGKEPKTAPTYQA
ncbi:MAG: flavin reductase [Candidatus Cloacimonetes bacterium]|nr:flavin reductase [Candidatus Cloacimonadota bacterium]MBT6994185.1 flavin reductase [Candidatus Cloacimonadota bacterium]MBT7469726.1 flavin reductase [Candidatus Cloacimonadota bacterium]